MAWTVKGPNEHSRRWCWILVKEKNATNKTYDIGVVLAEGLSMLKLVSRERRVGY